MVTGSARACSDFGSEEARLHVAEDGARLRLQPRGLPAPQGPGRDRRGARGPRAGDDGHGHGERSLSIPKGALVTTRGGPLVLAGERACGLRGRGRGGVGAGVRGPPRVVLLADTRVSKGPKPVAFPMRVLAEAAFVTSTQAGCPAGADPGDDCGSTMERSGMGCSSLFCRALAGEAWPPSSLLSG